MITFSCLSRTDLPDSGTDIATMVRCALAEVCTVPVLLLLFIISVDHIGSSSGGSLVRNQVISCLLIALVKGTETVQVTPLRTLASSP